MRKLALSLAVGCCLIAAAPVLAATSCFDWSCVLGGCDFDASCSSASPFIWRYSFDYGDGTGSGLTSNPVQEHGYSENQGQKTVTLWVLYWSEPGETEASCTIDIGYTVGPIEPLTGRCSFSD